MQSSFVHLRWLGLPLVALVILLSALPSAAFAGSAGSITHSQALPAALAPLGPVRLVKDINPNLMINTHLIGQPLSVGSLAYFSAETLDEGAELWKTDGTPTGTKLVADIIPGLQGSLPIPLAGIGGKLVFSAQDDQAGRELWVSDGTASGTLRLADINPGTDSSLNNAVLSIVLGDRLFFEANDSAHGNELWVSDGTPQGTHLLADLNPGPESSGPHGMAGSGNTLYVFASNATAGTTLWKSDGTSQGTQAVATFPNPVTGSPTVLNGALLFAGNAADTGSELWRSDGTAAGTRLVADINPGSGSSFPSGFVQLGGNVLFVASNPTYGSELWRSDGTAAGTRLVADLVPGNGSPGISALTVVGSMAYFLADYPEIGYNLWKSDGTAAGTNLVKSIIPAGNKWQTTLVSVGDRLFFYADDGVHGLEPWTSDGTPQGTQMVADLSPGAAGSKDYFGTTIVDLKGKALFVAITSDSGTQLWQSDGTAQGTSRVSAFNLSLGASAEPQALTPVGDELLFMAAPTMTVATELNHWSLWRSDGSTRGTQPAFGDLTDAIFPVGKYPFTTIIPVGHELFIFTSALVNQDVGCTAETRLYRQTAAGPLLLGIFAGEPSIKCIQVGATGIQGAVAFQSQFYFLTLNGELWVSDGTARGTRMLKRLGTDLKLYESQLVVFKGALYFLTYGLGDSTRVMLWRSDGSAAGTLAITSFAVRSSLSPYSGPQWNQLQPVGGRLFFSLHSDDSTQSQLWASDGTAQGTQALTTLTAPARGLAGLSEKVLFLSGPQLWASDGTAQATRVIQTFKSTQVISWSLASTAAISQMFYFNADDGVHGYELWRSDGSAAGTSLVKDVTPGTSGDGPQRLTAAAGQLLFSADDGVHGRELWQSDGSAAGTQLVTDLAPGSDSSNPTEITSAAGTIFFSAETRPLGRELWAIAGAEGVDLTLEIPARVGVAPGGVVPLRVSYRNRGATAALSPTLRIDLSPELRYLGDSSGLTPIISGTQLSWPLADLASMEHSGFTLLLSVPEGELGSRLGLQLAVDSVGPEASPDDNRVVTEVWLARQTRLPLAGR